MRKIIVCTFLTLDGVMQAPGGPDEDAGWYEHSDAIRLGRNSIRHWRRP